MQEKPGSGLMGVHVEVVNAARIKSAGPADEPVHFIPLAQKQFRRITAVLPGDAGNYNFRGIIHGLIHCVRVFKIAWAFLK
jgi:hypothetical protein